MCWYRVKTQTLLIPKIPLSLSRDDSSQLGAFVLQWSASRIWTFKFCCFGFFFLTELKCLEIIFLLFFCVRKSKLFEVRPVIKRGEIVENGEQHRKYKTIPNFA